MAKKTKSPKAPKVEADTSESEDAPQATVRDVVAAVGRLAPFHLAYDWDNVGHQLGDSYAAVQRVAVGLEVTDALIDFALTKNCQAIITHHPLIFRPWKSVRADDPAQRRFLELARHGLSLIVAHTNLDRVLHGTNGILARRIGLENLSILEPTEFVDQYKVTVFVPAEYSNKLMEAFHRAGGGRIGQYSHCTFRTPGRGTFLGDTGSQPFFAEANRLEEVEEDRLECLVPAARLAAVMAELKAAHPYEEMAADVYPVKDWAKPYGLGVVGEIPGPRVHSSQVAQSLMAATGENHVSLIGKSNPKVRRVAICTGSPGPSIHSARQSGADLLVTGEIGYHLAMEAQDRNMTILACGHAASERIFAPEFSRQMTDAMDQRVEFLPFERFPEPYTLIHKDNSVSG